MQNPDEPGDYQLVEHLSNFGVSVLPWIAVRNCSEPGVCASEAVGYWAEQPDVELPDPAGILRELQETGAWEFLDDPEENRRRYLWIICCDLMEQLNQGEPIYIHNPENN